MAGEGGGGREFCDRSVAGEGGGGRERPDALRLLLRV